MNIPEPLECVLCHRTDRDVTVALLVFQEDGQRWYSTDPRCPDHTACRQRVEAAGEEWPLVPR